MNSFLRAMLLVFALTNLKIINYYKAEPKCVYIRVRQFTNKQEFLLYYFGVKRERDRVLEKL